MDGLYRFVFLLLRVGFLSFPAPPASTRSSASAFLFPT
jgi:hypothetical protein